MKETKEIVIGALNGELFFLSANHNTQTPERHKPHHYPLKRDYNFTPIAFETFGPMDCTKAFIKIIKKIGKLLQSLNSRKKIYKFCNPSNFDWNLEGKLCFDYVHFSVSHKNYCKLKIVTENGHDIESKASESSISTASMKTPSVPCVSKLKNDHFASWSWLTTGQSVLASFEIENIRTSILDK